MQLADGHASYVFYDEGTAGRMLFEADLPALDDDVEAMLFGAISLIPEPCGSTYEALMRREHGRRVTMLDPNIRPDFIPDRNAHLARMERMMGMADIVKLSDEDLAWLGFAERPQDFVDKWLEQGPKLIVVTRGSRGATAHARGLAVSVTPPRVSVVDTVGAGDTFNAGLLASLHAQGALTRGSIAGLTEAAIRGALELAAKAAAVTVSRAGANPPWKHELGLTGAPKGWQPTRRTSPPQEHGGSIAFVMHATDASGVEKSGWLPISEESGWGRQAGDRLQCERNTQWQRTRSASGTTRTPRLPPASTPRPFPTARWAPCTARPATTRPARRATC